jgi:hypothetical protein
MRLKSTFPHHSSISAAVFESPTDSGLREGLPNFEDCDFISARMLRCVLAALLVITPAHVLAGQRPAAGQVKVQADTLVGIQAMSVSLLIEGIRDLPEATYRSDIESRLKAAGIAILAPTENPRTYPHMRLTVNADFLRDNNGRLSGSLSVWSLQLEQLFPRTAGGGTVYYRGTTWQVSGRVVDSSIGIVAALRREYTKAVDEFVQDYLAVNGKGLTSTGGAATIPSPSLREPAPSPSGRTTAKQPEAAASAAGAPANQPPTARSWWDSMLGTWQGTSGGPTPKTITLELTRAGANLAAIIKTSDGLTGETRANIVSGANEVTSPSSSQIRFDGRLSADGTTITGQLTVWFWTPRDVPLTLSKR